MDIGVGLPPTIPDTPGADILDWACRAEEQGFSAVGVLDRLVYDNYEPLVALAAAGAVTRRIRLAATILIAPYRRSTALLAKQLASIDRLSGGRLVLGVAAGGREDDFAATGACFADRGVRLDAMLAEVRRIWTGGDARGIGPRPVGAGLGGAGIGRPRARGTLSARLLRLPGRQGGARVGGGDRRRLPAARHGPGVRGGGLPRAAAVPLRGGPRPGRPARPGGAAVTLQLLAAGAVVGSGMVAGVLFAVALSTLPALFAMPPARYVETHRLLGAHWDPTMPVLVLGSAGADAVLALRWTTTTSRRCSWPRRCCCSASRRSRTWATSR
jgi:hypothetical protein